MVNAAIVIDFVRTMLVIGCMSIYPVERLLRALQRMMESVRDSDPFVTANTQRLRVIGWSTLALQLLDLLCGAAFWWARAHRIEVLDWQPSLTGWLAVLVAFVLIRVFAAGTALREDVDATI